MKFIHKFRFKRRLSRLQRILRLRSLLGRVKRELVFLSEKRIDSFERYLSKKERKTNILFKPITLEYIRNSVARFKGRFRRTFRTTLMLRASLLAFLLCLLLFPVLVQGTQALVDSGSLDQVEFVIETIKDGKRQMLAEIQGKDVIISDDGLTNVDLKVGERYAVWSALIDSTWQVFAYDLIAQERIKLTSLGNNVKPVTSGEYVAWQGQENGVWRAYLFDGKETKVISEGDEPVQEITLESPLLAYSQMKSHQTGWGIQLHNLEEGTKKNLTVNAFGSEPEIIFGVISWKDQFGKRHLNFSQQTPTLRTLFFATPTPTERPEEEIELPTPTPQPTPEVEDEVEIDPENEVEASNKAEASEEAEPIISPSGEKPSEG